MVTRTPHRPPLSALRPRLRAVLCALGLVLAAALPAAASSADTVAEPLAADSAFRLSAARDAEGSLTLRWRIAPGTYLYRESLTAQKDGAPLPLVTGPAEEKDDPNFGRVEVYRHTAQATLAGLPEEGRLDVAFQGCAEAGVCYPVVKRQVDLATLAVSAPPAGARFAVAFAPLAGEPAQPAPPPTDGITALVTGGLGVMLAGFFGFGLLLAFTPCVFPMLPILSGILAGGSVRPSPMRGLALAGAYGLAMALAYGLLGAAAGWSGANLQAALQAPWALGLLAAVFVALGLSMFGLFDLALPASLSARMGAGRANGSLLGAGALGFASALVVGPCVTPPLAAAMLYAAQTGDAARGGAALFMLGLGMGVPLVAVGAFGARILPRSGPWLERIRQTCGVLFLGVAAFLAGRLLPASTGLALWGVLALGLGVFAGGLDRLASRSPATARLGKAAGLAAVIYGAVLMVGAAGGADDPLRPLAFLAGAERQAPAPAREVRVTSPAALDAALAATTAGGPPLLVSFTADWCTVCKSNAAVMAEPAVQERLARLPRVAVDVTAYGDDARAVMQRFSVVGPPTLFLWTAAGGELAGSRQIGALSRADIETLAAQAGL